MSVCIDPVTIRLVYGSAPDVSGYGVHPEWLASSVRNDPVTIRLTLSRTIWVRSECDGCWLGWGGRWMMVVGGSSDGGVCGGRVLSYLSIIIEPLYLVYKRRQVNNKLHISDDPDRNIVLLSVLDRWLFLYRLWVVLWLTDTLDGWCLTGKLWVVLAGAVMGGA